jgi:ArsR family transcriptional regulator, arsenate/arsenite/antimonite-responsive transcriptional repressor
MRAPAVNLMFKAFSDRTRLRILHLLLKGEVCVCDIVAITRVPQPTASRHLAYLRRAGLILGRKDGLWNYYRLAPAESSFHRSLMKCLKECFTDVPELAADAKRASKAGVCCQPSGKACCP